MDDAVLVQGAGASTRSTGSRSTGYRSYSPAPVPPRLLGAAGREFRIRRGETVGIVGQNGSGKSTLLQLLAGVLTASQGTVEVRGRVAALLELGASFNPDFTGRENALLNGAILGIAESEMRGRLGEIAAFADIGEFFDRPVKTYSSGMYVRLAFATAISVEPDALVDEALAVGDAQFQHRCMLRMADLQRRGVTLVLVSHDVAAIKRLCQRAIWLDGGTLMDDGDPATGGGALPGSRVRAALNSPARPSRSTPYPTPRWGPRSRPRTSIGASATATARSWASACSTSRDSRRAAWCTATGSRCTCASPTVARSRAR